MESNKTKGYVLAVCDDSDFYIPNAMHIERNDNLKPWQYKDDAEAAKGAETDGVKLIYNMKGVDDGVYIDTPENRKIIETVLNERMNENKDSERTKKPSILNQIKEKTTTIPSAEKKDTSKTKDGLEV